MNRFSFQSLAVILAAVSAVFIMAFFIGCDNGDDGTPSQSPPDVTGTYYAIADFGVGDQSIMLVLQMPSSEPANDGYYVLTGFVSYSDSSWGVAGTTKEDSVNFTWTPPDGVCNFSGTSGDEKIQGTASGPGWTVSFTAHRETGTGRDIAGQWEGGFLSGGCYPPGGTLTVSFFQTDNAIAGTLFVSADPEMGDTLVITEGFFHDPIYEVTAIDSGTFPPARLILLGTLGADDSLAGGYDWWWDRCFDEGFWHLERATVEPPDTSVFSGILGVVFIREGSLVTSRGASVYWQIGGIGVTGASVTCGGAQLQDLGSGYYMTLPGALNVIPGAEYAFNISHTAHGSTSETVRVPSDFSVTSPEPDAVISVGEDLVVTFTTSANANFYTAMFDVNAVFRAVPAPIGTITLPGSGIQTTGADILEVEAMRGNIDLWQGSGTGFFGLVGKTVNVTVQ
jgi:hypothetical protein